MKLSTIKTSKYELKTNFDIDNIDFFGIYQTDLLSAAIKSANIDNVLVTIINNLNTIALAVMIDLKAVIIVECDSLSSEMIEKANHNKIPIFITKMKSYEVVIDLYNRGLI